MAYEGEIEFPFNHRPSSTLVEVEFKSTGDSDDSDYYALKAPCGEFSQGCWIEQYEEDSNCKIRNARNYLVGWIRFDGEDETDIESLKCIAIAKEETNENWNKYAAINWHEKLVQGIIYYVLLVTCATPNAGYQRLGVAVIQGEHLSEWDGTYIKVV